MRRSVIAVACAAGFATMVAIGVGTAKADSPPSSLPLTCSFSADVPLSPGIGLLTNSGGVGSETTNAHFKCTGSLNGYNITGGDGVMTGHYKGNCFSGSAGGSLIALMHTDNGLTFPVNSTWKQAWSGLPPAWASLMSFASTTGSARNAGAMTTLSGNCLGHVTAVRITAAGISLQ